MAIILVQLRPNCRRRAERRWHAATILGQKKKFIFVAKRLGPIK